MDNPSFLIIGAAKCGTTSLYRYLLDHPNVHMAVGKEIHYFDNPVHFKGNNTHNSYKKRFVTNNPNIKQTGEATPVYCFLPEAMERIHAFNPKVKLIMLLRDPVWRAISHYYMEFNRKREKLPLSEAIDKEPKRHRVLYSYCARGYYVDQIDHILSLFPRSQLLLIRLEDLAATPQVEMDRVTDFLEIPKFSTDYRPHFTGAYPTPNKTVVEKLAKHFKPYNEKLHKNYGIKVSDWT